MARTADSVRAYKYILVKLELLLCVWSVARARVHTLLDFTAYGLRVHLSPTP